MPVFGLLSILFGGSFSGILGIGFTLCLVVIISRLIYVAVTQVMISPHVEEERKNERKMDFFESVLDEFHTLGGANMCCGLNLKSKSSLLYDHVYNALEFVSKKYPLLRTVIVQKCDGHNKIVKYLRVLDNKNMVTLNKLSGEDWVSVWEKEVQTKFDCESGPLWRTSLLKERYDAVKGVYHNCLLFTFYHGTMDGLAVLKFAQEFVNCLEKISKGILIRENDVTDVNKDILPGVMSLLAPRQFLHFKIMQWLLPEFALVQLVKFAMRINLLFDVKNPILSQFAGITSVKQERIKIIPYRLNPESTEKLMTLCRKNACTVYGAMLACCHLAVAQLLGGSKIKPVNDPVRFGWYCPVNVRNQCVPRIQQDDLGSYTTVLMENAADIPNIPPANPRYSEHTSTANPRKFWNFAKQCTRKVHNGIRNGRHLFSLYLLPISHLLDPKEFVSEFILHSKMKQSELMSPVHSLTNLGKIDWKKEKDDTYEIESVFGGSGAYRHGATFVNHMATFNGVFIWSTSYITTSVSEEIAEQYVDMVFKILHDVLSFSEEE